MMYIYRLDIYLFVGEEEGKRREEWCGTQSPKNQNEKERQSKKPDSQDDHSTSTVFLPYLITPYIHTNLWTVPLSNNPGNLEAFITRKWVIWTIWE